MKPRRVAILGSTGSIGNSALDVVRHLPDRLSAVALSTHNRVDLLIEQVEAFHPKFAAITGATPSEAQRKRIERAGATLLLGHEALCEIAKSAEVDVVLLAIVGSTGVRVAIETVAQGKTLALANKETLVIAGSIIMPLAKQHDAAILPVDSEHSAIFQCLAGAKREDVRRVILTASGGPFRTMPIEQFRNSTAADAMNHPTWNMGAKVTIDSSTMFNKALEIIEAAWLFDLPAEKIEVVIHPQSVIHSMVEYADGSTIAQLSPPDMRLPIQYALTYPHRPAGPAKRIDFSRSLNLTFEPPDLQRFPSLRMGFEVIRRGGTSGAVLNAANEIAVAALQAGQIRVGMIYDVVDRTIERHSVQQNPTLDDLLKADRWARETAEELIEEMTKDQSPIRTQ